MKVIEAGVEIHPFDRTHARKKLEICEWGGKHSTMRLETCSPESAPGFCEKCLEMTHHTVLRHDIVRVQLTTNRGISHEFVRHQHQNPTQESTRYCSYKGDINFVRPWHLPVGGDEFSSWCERRYREEKTYHGCLADGWSAQEARDELSHNLATRLAVTATLHEWGYIFYRRCSLHAHPGIRQIMMPLLVSFQRLWPELYDGFKFFEGNDRMVGRIDVPASSAWSRDCEQLNAKDPRIGFHW